VTTVFVTHDQEEAMEVADEIVVINNGRVEQVGTPDQLYDEPANDFVMSFLGEVTRLGPVRLRPHDVEVATTPGRAGSFPGTITRHLRVGFEVRLQVELDYGAGGGTGADPVSVVLSRSHARSLDLELGSKVWLTAAVGAVTVPAMVAV
jgi:sulfate transport system ATP-binding protein